MKSYIDSSVLLRLILEEPQPFDEWDAIEEAASSSLVAVECFRTVDRVRFERHLEEDEVARRYEALHALLEPLGRISLTQPILDRAAEPFPFPLKTLDAIHLSTAILWRQSGVHFAFATHDRSLALAARAMGFQVIGQ